LIPTELRANFDVSFSVIGGADVPAGYTPKFVLGGATSLIKSGAVSDNDITFALTASETTNLTTGQYWYQVVAEDGLGARVFITEGTIYVIGKITGAGTFDGRSVAEKILEAIDATILGKATADQQSYVIQSGSGSRSLSRIPVTELRELRKDYAAIVAAEKRSSNDTPLFRRHTFAFVKE
jgi:hypothetical protein